MNDRSEEEYGPEDVVNTPNYYLMCECLFITTFMYGLYGRSHLWSWSI